MNVIETSLPGVLIIEPKVFGDSRGFFIETFRDERYAPLGIRGPFVQDNYSRSVKNTLRGLHLQNPKAQGKLVMAMRGTVWDVAVDVRRGSPHFGKWEGVLLSEENKRQLWVPPGFAHGFCVVSESADFFYKCTDVYAPDCESTVQWNDPAIGVKWPLTAPILSSRDAQAAPLKDQTRLPSYP